jgi:hypothetical protein
MYKLLKTLEKLIIDNSPAILTAMGVTGTITTAYLTAKASFKAAANEEARGGSFGKPVEVFKDRARNYWKLYIPAATMGALTIVCIVGANRIGNRRAAAIATAYSLSEKVFSEYREQVVEKLGSSKERVIRDEVAQKQIIKNPLADREVIITGDGDVLCYEAYTGRYFNSSMEALRKAQNNINFNLLNDGYVSLTDFYNEIGIPRTSASDEVGWKNDSMLDLQFSTTLSDDGRPCISIDYRVEPIRNYYR